MAHPQTRRGHEAQNLHALGLLVARSALAREESRGAHYRTDFPIHNDAKFLKHSIAQRRFHPIRVNSINHKGHKVHKELRISFVNLRVLCGYCS